MFSPEVLSPSVLDFPALVLSPVTPLSPSVGNSSEEEKAIAEKGFYLHPSPRTVEVTAEPRLLPLFPETSEGGGVAGVIMVNCGYKYYLKGYIYDVEYVVDL